MRRIVTGLLALLCTFPGAAFAAPCGEVVSIATHDGTTTRYSFGPPQSGARARAALVLLAGGGGVLNLDDGGCARALEGNSLVRSADAFRALGFATALVDAPSDHNADEDGLRGFRSDAKHAEDLGRIVADLRARVGAPVWILGTSRGSISAVNAASRLKGAQAPDGIVLTSALMAGGKGNKSWVRDSVFDHDLGAIKLPALVVGHAGDKCTREPRRKVGQCAQAGGHRHRRARLEGRLEPESLRRPRAPRLQPPGTRSRRRHRKVRAGRELLKIP
jgi:hypothetical protein